MGCDKLHICALNDETYLKVELELAQFFAIHFHFRTMCEVTLSVVSELRILYL